jgi:peptidoglycan/xylan/chitin deacetylase (PgdA/CDA1 family)
LTDLFRHIKRIVKERVAPITHVDTDQPLVAITFDDGPHPVYTPILLEVFKKFRAHATFFMVGQEALKYRSIVEQAALEGHEIGNHTMDHFSMRSIGRRQRLKQLWMCQKALSPYGRRSFRPPYGEQDGWTNIDALMMGYRLIGWDLDVFDWCNNEFNSMHDNIRKKIEKGSIILFHDSIYDKGSPKHKVLEEKADLNRETMVELVKAVLKEFSGRYRFVTIHELIKNGRPVRLRYS